MRNTLVLAGIGFFTLVLALLSPRPAHPRLSGSRDPLPPPADSVPPTFDSTTASLLPGSLSLDARPERRSFDSDGDDFATVLSVTAARPASAKRHPVDFALVLDRSGSMAGEPLEKAKEAAVALVRRLSSGDRLAIVHFGGEARLGLSLTPMDGAGREAAELAIGRIAADGNTNIAAALQTAGETLRAASPVPGSVQRIVLISDGEANEGRVGPSLVQLARNELPAGVRLSALGLGRDFDDNLMMALADAGRGQYRFLHDACEIESALTAELQQASGTAGTEITLSLTPGPGVELLEAMGVSPQIVGTTWRLPIRDLALGETRHLTVRLHVRPGDTGAHVLVTSELAYRDALADFTPHVAHANAAAKGTHDTAEISASIDVEAARIALRARWGSIQMHAAQEFGRNDATAGNNDIRSAAASMMAAAQTLGDHALGDDVRSWFGASSNGLAGGNTTTYTGKKSLQTFGRMNQGL